MRLRLFKRACARLLSEGRGFRLPFKAHRSMCVPSGFSSVCPHGVFLVMLLRTKKDNVSRINWVVFVPEQQ